jgi:2-polyprenyl-3-methyl-5-hydroxy-6-metoxy-1,4-benzoquinol methylase
LLTPLACWCGAGDLRTLFRTKRFGLVRCTRCGCFRIDPPPISGEEEGADFYTNYYARAPFAKADEKSGSPNGPKGNSRFWRVVERVPDLGRPRQRVADIGCGEGGLCAELKAAGWPSVAGFDLSRTRIARARKKQPGIEFHDRAFPDSRVPEGSLDLVIMDNVVEHLPDPPTTLRSVARSLKPGGRLVLITPNMSSGQFRLLGRRWTVELSPHAHIFLFTTQALSRLVSMCGFVVETTGSFHLEPYPAREMLRQWRRGEYKEAVWHAMNEAGARYARLIKSGPMLYTVARQETSA